MLDQNTFIETVQSVAEIIRTSAEPIGSDAVYYAGGSWQTSGTWCVW